jgi:hypothetical protein
MRVGLISRSLRGLERAVCEVAGRRGGLFGGNFRFAGHSLRTFIQVVRRRGSRHPAHLAVLGSIAKMNIWRRLLQIVGVLNLALSVVACYAMIIVDLGVSRHPHVNPQEPFFPTAFWILNGINVAFLVAFDYVSIMLIRLQLRAAIAHTCLFVALIFYISIFGPLWLIPNGVGSSIGGATGVGNTGVEVLLLFPLPLLYPLLSVLCVNIARFKLKRAVIHAPSDIRHE